MRIGYSVEGSTDRALLRGLQQRWCPAAQLVEGSFRGASRQSRRREVPKICLELSTKGADTVVFLSDSNDDDPNAWRAVLQAEQGRVPTQYAHLVVVGVCQRNVECWLCADADWTAKRTGRSAADFRISDPKGPFEEAMGISARDRKEEEIAALVREAPLWNWLANASFEHFYDKLWRESKQRDCQVENLRERP